MKRTQDNSQFKYRVDPNQYPIEDNTVHSTYDQFIQLRDTLVYSSKQYSNHPGKKLIVGYKADGSTTQTVEVQEREYFRQSFEPGYENDNEKITTQILGDYITLGTEEIQEGLLCTINRDGHYRIERKIQMYQLDDQISKIYGSVRHHTKNGDSWQEIPRAVWDYEMDFTKTYPGTFSGTTSGTDPNGSCSGSTSTVVSFKLGEIFKKITPEGYIEADMKKGDWLEFKLVKDEQDTPIDSTTYMQPYSNRWSIQYIDLPYNTLK